MDVMMCDYIGHLKSYKDTGNAYNNFMRNWSINSYVYQIQDITEFMRTRPNIQYRYMATASAPLTSGADELSVDHKLIEGMIDLGMKDGKDIIAKGEGYYFKKLLEYDAAKKAGEFEGEFPDFVYQ